MATIEFTEEQTMLLETAVDFCRKNSPLDGVRRQIELDDSVDDAIWSEMADLGWLGITIPEQYGGLGLSLAVSSLFFLRASTWALICLSKSFDSSMAISHLFRPW